MASDLVSQIMAYEDGTMPDEDVVPFFQRLIDTGVVWHLQGSYQREAMRLCAAGECHARR